MHIDEETLSAYALDRALVDDPGAVEAHLRECSRCRDEVEAARDFDALAGDRDTWTAADGMREPDPRLQEVLERRNEMAAEEADAERRLAPYLESPIRLRGKRLADDPRFVTAGAVRVLCTAARGEHERRPRFSHALAVQACELAELLKDEDRRDCGMLAYRERANALRYLGRFREALEALASAEKFILETPTADFDRAIVNYIRATVWMKSERMLDAIPLARAAADVFRKYGDDERELAAVMAEGACLLFLGMPARAVEPFERVRSLARRRSQPSLLARALNNAAECYREMGDFERALAYYTEAAALYDELDFRTEQVRARWSLATTLLASGQLSVGIDALAGVRDELAAMGLTNDAAIASLQWAEARLAVGMTDGVADVCRRIMLTFESENMERNARVALAYLHEALAKGSATPQIVRHVRMYLETLSRTPDHPFTPLS